MKKLIAFLSIFIIVNISYAENNPVVPNALTGDTALACEAILCLSSSTRPTECAKSIAKYFGLRDPKSFAKTLNIRKSFLNLCPTSDDGEIDQILENFKDEVILLKTDCNAEAFNQMIDSYTQTGGKDGIPITYYRVAADIPEVCERLSKHSYTDIKLPTYRCSGEYYREDIWNSGYVEKNCWTN
ncbi:TrbM/KikA/MpfK family conjugal transfer protein [Orbus wheelerorum]|uniref:TrbM/KikA/MpfK family conjugal transfer protein n=1 Tax=Orbus wheelerorum TaxID=3074111 RepID=UPI00370D1211